MRAGIIVACVALVSGAAYGTRYQRQMCCRNGSILTIDRIPGVGIAVSKEGQHLSWSHSVGHVPYASATASATASDPNFAYASARSNASVRTNANGKSIAHSNARAVAIGQSSSTSAVSKP